MMIITRLIKWIEKMMNNASRNKIDRIYINTGRNDK